MVMEDLPNTGWTFFTLFFKQNCIVCLISPKINKGAENGNKKMCSLKFTPSTVQVRSILYLMMRSNRQIEKCKILEI